MLKISNISQNIYCTYMPSNIKCGKIYITDKNQQINFGESVVISDRIDFDQFVKNNELIVISLEKIEDINIDVYLLYSKYLPKYRIVNNKKYNLQVCLTQSSTKIGYPAIFDSF